MDETVRIWAGNREVKLRAREVAEAQVVDKGRVLISYFAICNPEDEFDFNTGSQIAVHRAAVGLEEIYNRGLAAERARQRTFKHQLQRLSHPEVFFALLLLLMALTGFGLLCYIFVTS